MHFRYQDDMEGRYEEAGATSGFYEAGDTGGFDEDSDGDSMPDLEWSHHNKPRPEKSSIL